MKKEKENNKEKLMVDGKLMAVRNFFSFMTVHGLTTFPFLSSLTACGLPSSFLFIKFGKPLAGSWNDERKAGRSLKRRKEKAIRRIICHSIL